MCGIVGYIGSKPAQDILISGLRRLEYRGYDSAGVATLSGKGLPTLVRSKGKVVELEKRLTEKKTEDSLGIGHTRWATHGEPSKRNAHPHHVGKVFLVHNGIIENYQDIKKMLAKHDYEMKSDTDTEVLAALIDYTLRSSTSLLEAVSGALNMTIGAYGIAVVSTDSPDEIIVAKKGSPLIVGIGNEELFIASDAAALLGYTKQVVYLKDGEIGVCKKGGVELYDLETRAVAPQIEKLEISLQEIQKNGFEHFLIKEIHDQPNSVRETLRGRLRIQEGSAQLGGINMTGDELRSVRHIFIVACGTANYAGMLSKYYIEQLTDDVAVSVEIASELRYRSFTVPPNSIALIVSQSGETADTLACLQELKRRGVRCLGVINAVGSTIAREVDGGVYLHAGPEISVASTKGFTSQVVAMIMFAIMLAESKGRHKEVISEIVNELAILPQQIESIIREHDSSVKELAKKYGRYDNAIYVGRDTLYPLALEGALKIKETSYIHAEGQAAGELKHGSIALLDDRFFEVCYMQDNWLFEKSQSNLVEMNARGAHAIVVTDSDRKIDAEEIIRVKTKLKHLTPLLFNVISQLFAYYMAVERDNDVDQPRNLAKSVTVE